MNESVYPGYFVVKNEKSDFSYINETLSRCIGDGTSSVAPIDHIVDESVNPVAVPLFRSLFPRSCIAGAMVMVSAAPIMLTIVGIEGQRILMEEGLFIVRADGPVVAVDGVSSPGQEFADLFIDIAYIGIDIFR